MSVSRTRRTFTDRAWERAKRPEDVVTGTRWLFAVLALISLLLCLVAAMGGPSALTRLTAIGVAGYLGASVVVGYLRQVPSRLGDVADAVGILVFALACPNPSVTLGFLFAALWFRALYGTTRQAVLRATMYALALAGSAALWTTVPGHPAEVELTPVLGAVPTMFLTVVVGRHLAGLLFARRQAARRDGVQAALGPQLLAVRDASEIRDLARDAVVDICRATPGLRLLKVSLDGNSLRVGRTSHALRSVPDTLPADAVPGLSGRDGAETAPSFSSTRLDEAAGQRCTWVSVALPEVPDERARAWFLLGFPSGVLAEVVTSIASLSDQIALALRNSEVHRELTQLATLDNLTGLANRASFNAALLAALADPRHPGQHTTVLFADLDDFKDVNDGLGHGAGDELLQEVAARLTRATRPGDLCARLGGDEFAVLLLATPVSPAADIALRVVTSLSAPIHLRDGTAQISASVGVATAVGPSSQEQLVHCADVAMYAAKAKGKGRVQVFEAGLLQRDSSLGAGDGKPPAATRQDELAAL